MYRACVMNEYMCQIQTVGFDMSMLHNCLPIVPTYYAIDSSVHMLSIFVGTITSTLCKMSWY